MERRTFTLQIGRYKIEHDRDYGIDKRIGWSLVIDGAVMSQLEPWLIVALWKGWRRWRVCDSYKSWFSRVRVR